MSTDRPNILIITDDQHHAGCLGGEDRPQVRTPHLDRMRREGVSFPRSYSPAAECVPSRIGFLTGMYGHSHGGYNGQPHYTAETESFPNVLRREAGYQTALIGKKHFGTWDVEPFDSDTGQTMHGWTHEYLPSVGLRDVWVEQYHGHVRDFLAYTSNIPYEHCEQAWVANETMARMERFDNRPFLVWCNFSAPHPPYINSFDSPHLYDPDDLDLSAIDHLDEADMRALAARPGSSRLGCENAWRIETVGERPYREALAHYYGMVSTVDACVGRLMHFLDKRGVLDDTIVVFTSDHGDFAGEYGMLGKNPTGQFECINRVPLYWYWRGRFGAERAHGFVENIDVHPTLCDLLDLPIHPQVQGESFADVLRYSSSGAGPGPTTKETVFFDNCYTKGVRTRHHRLTYHLDRADWGELYDLQRDPHERVNVFHEPRYLRVRDALMGELVRFYMRTEQPRGVQPAESLHPPYRWHRQFAPPQPNDARIAADQRRPWEEPC